MRNPHLPGAELGFSPLELDPEFPLEIILDGQRDDTAITRLHIHDGLEIGCCIEGSGTFYVGSKILPFQAGDITVITEHEFHRCRSSPGGWSRWVWFFLHPLQLLIPHAVSSLTWEPERFSGSEFNNVIRPAAYPKIAALAGQLMAEARMNDGAVRANLRALLVVFLNELHRAFARPERSHTPLPSAQALARIAPALLQIATHFDQALTVPELAKCCAMSVRNFQLQFGMLMGLSPQTHLIQSRIQAAAALLGGTARPVTDIAFACGFQTLSSFNRAFKTILQCSPRDYRTHGRPPETA